MSAGPCTEDDIERWRTVLAEVVEEPMVRQVDGWPEYNRFFVSADAARKAAAIAGIPGRCDACWESGVVPSRATYPACDDYGPPPYAIDCGRTHA